MSIRGDRQLFPQFR